MERELSYDLHIHSCLSPCGDDDMTPGNIVGMAAIKGLDVIAVTQLLPQLPGGSEAGGAVRCVGHTRHGADYCGRSTRSLLVFRAFRGNGI